MFRSLRLQAGPGSHGDLELSCKRGRGYPSIQQGGCEQRRRSFPSLHAQSISWATASVTCGLHGTVHRKPLSTPNIQGLGAAGRVLGISRLSGFCSFPHICLLTCSRSSSPGSEEQRVSGRGQNSSLLVATSQNFERKGCWISSTCQSPGSLRHLSSSCSSSANRIFLLTYSCLAKLPVSAREEEWPGRRRPAVPRAPASSSNPPLAASHFQTKRVMRPPLPRLPHFLTRGEQGHVTV